MKQTEGTMGEPRQLSLEAQRLESEITARGYAEVVHGIDEEEIAQIVEAYTDFTLAHPDPEPKTMHRMLPGEPSEQDLLNDKYYDEEGTFSTKKWLAKQLDELDRAQDIQPEWHKYRTNAVGIGKPDGYTNRTFQVKALAETRGIQLEDDPKEFFHYTPRHYANIARNHAEFGWGAIPPEVAALGNAFAPVHHKAVTLLLRTMSLVEERHPGIRDLFDQESLRKSPLRLLFYHPDESPYLGGGHYDKALWTQQIGESHEGLRVAPNEENDLVPVVRDRHHAVVFPGYSFRDNVGPDTIFQPGWHDIVRTDALNDGRSVPERAAEVCVRWAMVFFANGANFVVKDKELMHAR